MMIGNLFSALRFINDARLQLNTMYNQELYGRYIDTNLAAFVQLRDTVIEKVRSIINSQNLCH